MPRILVLDEISEEGIAPLRAATGTEVTCAPPQSADELCKILPGYDGVLVRSATKVHAEAMKAAAPQLKAIGRAGVGVDNIDLEAASELGIAVFNSPAGNVNAAAEHTLALMMGLARHVHRGDRSLREGVWNRKALGGTELSGKQLGVLGFGRVGRIVTGVAQALGMFVHAYDPFVPADSMEELGVTHHAGLETILGSSDWVTLHLPATPETRGLINAETLALMKPTARLVNVARGALIDEAALYDALTSGGIAAAALDVFGSEPCTDSPLFKLENVLVTPHLGASTAEAQVQVALDVSNSVTALLRSGDLTGAVNASRLG